MKVIKNILFALSIALIMLGCAKDDGNYDYTTQGKELGFGLMQSPGTFTVKEKVEVIPTYEFRDLTLTENDLSYAWKLNGTEYCTTKTLVGKDLMPGNYVYELLVTDNRFGTVYSLSGSFTITSEFVDGWMVLVDKNAKSELCYLQLADKSTPKDLMQNIYASANNNQELGSDPRKLAYHSYADGVKGVYHQLAVYQGGGQGSVELFGGSMVKDINIDKEFLSKPSAVPTNGFYRQYGNLILMDDGNMYFKNDVFVNGISIPHSSRYGTPIYVADGGVKAQFIIPMNGLADAIPMPYANNQFCLVYDKLNKRYLSVAAMANDNTGRTTTLNIYGKDTLLPGAHVEGATDETLVWPGAGDLKGYDVIAGMPRAIVEGSNGEAHVASILKRNADSKYYLFQFGYWLTRSQTDIDLEIFEEFAGSPYINDNSIFHSFISGEPYLYFTGGTNNNELYFFNFDTKVCSKVYTASSRITAIKPGVVKNWEWAEFAEGLSAYTDRIMIGTEGGELVLFNIDNGAAQIEVMKTWTGVGKVVDIEFLDTSLFNV